MTRNDVAEATLARAADWFERLQNDAMDAKRIAEWQRWLTQSPANREAFNKCQDLWRRLDDVPVPPLPSREEMGLSGGSLTLPRWALAAGLACMCLIGAVLLAALPWNRGLATKVYETATAGHQEAQLPDGSHLSLGAKSLVWIRFEEERTVALERGEAFFEVAADKTRPFVVHAGAAAITALGTAFNVRRTGERLLVAVTDGVVLVGIRNREGSDTPVQLRAGERLILERPGAQPRITNFDPSSADTWRTGRLEYRGEPLKYVVADVNRYLPEEVVIADPQVGRLLITGTLFTEDVQAWLAGLSRFLPVQVDSEDGRMVLREKRR